MPTLSLAMAVVIPFLLVSQAVALCPLGPTARRIVACNPDVPTEKCRKLAEKAGCDVVRELELINAIVIDVSADMAKSADRQLASLPEVRRVEADRKINWLKSTLGGFQLPPVKDIVGPGREVLLPPSTPKTTDPEQPWGIRRVNAPAAWSRTQGAGVKVAVIDTGIDHTHPDLRDNIYGGYGPVHPDDPKNFKDDQGHGTHVSGTIGAIRNGEGVAGVAPKVKLYGVKVLDAEGNGDYSTIMAGIEWAVKNKMDVANMSLGADEGTESLRELVAAASKKGLVIVAAAGNNGGAVSYPAAYPEVIAVSASDPQDRIVYFSSRGSEIDFIAPGAGIKSTWLGGGYQSLDGTSMASPHVAGLAALAVSQGYRGLGSVGGALRRAASELPKLTDEQQGYGLIDAARIK